MNRPTTTPLDPERVRLTVMSGDDQLLISGSLALLGRLADVLRPNAPPVEVADASADR